MEAVAISKPRRSTSKSPNLDLVSSSLEFFPYAIFAGLYGGQGERKAGFATKIDRREPLKRLPTSGAIVPTFHWTSGGM